MAIVAGVWAALTLPQRRETVTEAARSAPGTDPASAPAAVPPADTAPAAAPATPAKAIRVTLETIRPVWLRVTVDGARAFEGELPAGEKLAVEGDRAVVVRAGDAGGVRATAERRRSRSARQGRLAAHGVDHAGRHRAADPDAA